MNCPLSCAGSSIHAAFSKDAGHALRQLRRDGWLILETFRSHLGSRNADDAARDRGRLPSLKASLGTGIGADAWEGGASRAEKKLWLISAASAKSRLPLASLAISCRPPKPFSATANKHIAVLPFENVGNDSSNEAVFAGLDGYTHQPAEQSGTWGEQRPVGSAGPVKCGGRRSPTRPRRGRELGCETWR